MASIYSFGAQYDEFIQMLVTSGRYTSAREVICDSLRLLAEQERIRESKLVALRSDIREGLQSGPKEPFDIGLVKQRAREARRSKNTSNVA